MREIPLTRGVVALVDDEDYETLARYKWQCSVQGYAVRTEQSDAVKRCIRMHRQIMGLGRSKMQVDHINGNRLDNQKANLRVCTNQENLRNMKPSKKRALIHSKYKGVSWCYTRWVAQIVIDGKITRIGYFSSEIEAARAYNRKARELHGEFYRGNDLGEGDVPVEEPCERKSNEASMACLGRKQLALF